MSLAKYFAQSIGNQEVTFFDPRSKSSSYDDDFREHRLEEHLLNIMFTYAKKNYHASKIIRVYVDNIDTILYDYRTNKPKIDLEVVELKDLRCELEKQGVYMPEKHTVIVEFNTGNILMGSF